MKPLFHCGSRGLTSAPDWTARPEFDEVCSWWKEHQSGVLALEGFGGAGKTAIVNRFLEELPNGIKPMPGVTKRDELPRPAGVFVFSFYQKNADDFIEELFLALQGQPTATQSPVNRSADDLRRLLQTWNRGPGADDGAFEAGSLLIVLDGLEMLQEPARGLNFGRLRDKRLSNLLKLAAGAYLPGVALLITSRLPLADINDPAYHHTRTVEIDDFQIDAAIQLLEASGAKGTRKELEDLAISCGGHALMLNLVGHYVRVELNGEANRFILAQFNCDSQDGVDVGPNSAKDLQLVRLGRAFFELAGSFDRMLAKANPAAMELLRILSLLPFGTTAEILAEIISTPSENIFPSQHLKNQSAASLTALLEQLVEVRLVGSVLKEPPNSGDTLSQRLFLVHPAISDAIKLHMSTDWTRSTHVAVSRYFVELLSGIPGSLKPTNLKELNLVESLIYHQGASGDSDQAWATYRDKLGYMRLAWELGQYERGRRIASYFTGSWYPAESDFSRIPVNDKISLVNDFGGFYSDIGLLDNAAKAFAFVVANSGVDKEAAAAAARSLSEIHLAGGYFLESLRASQQSVCFASEVQDETSRLRAKRQALTRLSTVHSLRGDSLIASGAFAEADRISRNVEFKPGRRKYTANYYPQTAHLLRCGKDSDAEERSVAAIRILSEEEPKEPNHQDIPKYRLILASIATKRKDLETAKNEVDKAGEWINRRSQNEMLCWLALVRARIEMAKRDRADSSLEQQRQFFKIETLLNEAHVRAIEYGLAVHRIDLLLERAYFYLVVGDPLSASRDIDDALFGKPLQSEDSSIRRLLGATDIRCDYAWAVSRGRLLKAHANMLRVLQLENTIPTGGLPPSVNMGKRSELLDEAKTEISSAIAVATRIGDPAIAQMQEIEAALAQGSFHNALTEYSTTKLIVKPIQWITSALTSFVAALSTNEPSQWLEPRVLTVAASTFLLEALGAHRSNEAETSSEEAITALRSELEALKDKMSLGSSFCNTVEQHLVPVVKMIVDLHGKVAEIANASNGLLNKLGELEKLINENRGNAHGNVTDRLVKTYTASLSTLGLLATYKNLYPILKARFSIEEIHPLCMSINVEPDNIAGSTRDEKAMNLLRRADRDRTTVQLMIAMEAMRSGVLGLGPGLV